MSEIQVRSARMMERHGFLGVPQATFEQAGREQLISLLREGLLPESKVVEFGCGCLRVAYWLVRFLDPGGYCGIEPAWERVRLGRQYLFDPGQLADKRPRFHRDADFDASVFGRSFDFFLARSIWTHASKRQIGASLDSFVLNHAPGAVFLTSILPARTEQEDYQGDSWVGTSHESDEPGVVRHCLGWIEEACAIRSIRFEKLAQPPDCDSQEWLRLSML